MTGVAHWRRDEPTFYNFLALERRPQDAPEPAPPALILDFPQQREMQRIPLPREPFPVHADLFLPLWATVVICTPYSAVILAQGV